jgi:hypothetical protein
MKKQIRSGVFETNSSSVHAISLQKNFDCDCEKSREKYKSVIPEEVVLKVDSGVGIHYEVSTWDAEKRNVIKATPKELVANKIIQLYSLLAYFSDANRDKQYGDPTAKKYTYKDLTRLFDYLNKLGIRYKIELETDNPVFIYDLPYNSKGWVDVELQVAMKDEVSFCNFLFGKGSGIDSIGTDEVNLQQYEKWENDLKKNYNTTFY